MSDESQRPNSSRNVSSSLAATPVLPNESLGSDFSPSEQRQNNFRPSPPCDNFGVAVICALPVEAAAVLALFEERWDGAGLDKAPADTNTYSTGSIGSHAVVLAHMPGMGKVAAATVAGNLRASFRHLRLVLVVGICGGAPNASKNSSEDVFLGDVVVSTGVIQYDLGRRFPGRFVRKDTPHDNLSRLSVVADGVLAKLKAAEAGRGKEFSRSVSRHLDALHRQLGSDAAYPGRGGDRLFQPDYLHKHHKLSECIACAESTDSICDRAAEKSCETLGCSQKVSNLVSRSPPEDRLQPTVHFGLVASGDTVMRSGKDRDEIVYRDSVIAFEMEAAGCWEILRECSCLIIKGVCDYADSHKSKLFQGYAAVVAAATAKTLLESWNAHMPGSLQPLPSRKTTPEDKEPTLSVKDVKLLGRLKTVSYQDRKDRNPHRVSGTCEWFVSHRLFNNWLIGSQGKDCQALWVSADPGCGKSVLAKYLVDHVLPSTQSRTTCYFFFKDDFEDQKSAANAMCCILHQLFTQKPILFSATVRTQLEAEGEKLTTSFRSLWGLLLKVAGEKNAGEIICILDALDECAADNRQTFARALLDQHRTKKAPNLKFLLTSRPIGSIRRDFQPSDTAELAVVHLSGENEEEMKQISKEIDVFIEARVRGVGAKLKLDKDEQDMLLHGLLSVSHRTYLWVYLTLDYIESNENINKRKIKEALSQLPESVDEAYEKILSTSRAPEEARKALHIIVAAERPLTLREMDFALAIRPSHQSYQDIDLDSDERFRERLRNICGLFVVVIDSKIYLLHQTAREFLVPADSQRARPKVAKQRKTTPRWKHCLEPAESQRTLGEICLWNLQLPELLQNAPELPQNAPEFLNDTPEQFPLLDGWNHLLRDYKFLEYSTYFWAAHLRALHTEVDKKLTQAMLDICLACHQHRPLWFRAAAREDQRAIMFFEPNIADDLKTTPLMIASYFGLVPVVKALVKAGREQLLARDARRRTALVWAAGCGHADVVRVLIDGQPRIPRGFGWLGIWKPAIDPAINRVILEAADCQGMTPLHWAARASSAGAVKVLLDNGADIEARGEYQNTPLLVAVENMEPDVTRLLLERGAYVEVSGDFKLTPLEKASRFNGVVSIMRLLLQFGADVDGRVLHRDGEPLFTAICYGRKDNVNLLLENKADVGLRDRNGDTAFTLACRLGSLDIAKLLLKKGVDIEERCKAGRSVLSRACLDGKEAVVRFLVEQGADIESRCNNNRTPLYYCLEGYDYSHPHNRGSIVKFLLDNGADLEARDQGGTSILAALTMSYYYHPTPFEWLLENGADIESQNLYGETPLVHALMRGNLSCSLLLRAGANVNVTTRDGRSVLQLVIAKYAGNFGWSTRHIDIKPLVEQLLKRGVDVEHRNKGGRTALSLAAACDYIGAEKIVRVLLAKGASIHSKDNEGRTPLFWATSRPLSNTSFRIAWLLLEHGADIMDIDDVDTRTALSRACSRMEALRAGVYR